MLNGKRHRARHATANVATHDSREELVQELRSALAHAREEGERLHRALDQAQTLHLGTMGELQRWQQRAAELEATNRQLIEAVPSNQETPRDMPQSTESASMASPEVSVGETPQETKAGSVTTRDSGGFWARLFGRS